MTHIPFTSRVAAHDAMLAGANNAEVARLVGVDAQTIRRWRREAGIAAAPSGGKISDERRGRVVELLMSGASQNAVARETGVSVGTVNAIARGMRG